MEHPSLPITNLDHDDSEVIPPAEPDVNSSNRDERILARRLRIEQTIEREKKGATIQPHSTETKEELSKGTQQIEISRQRLKKLLFDGVQLVTNVRTAADSRESQRRLQYEESCRTRRERMHQEARSSAERFEEINRKWQVALKKEIPHSLYESLQEQKKSCDLVLEEKNKLINDFQLELKKVDDNYVKDLKKQSDDITLLVERMDEQVKTQVKAFRDELDEIERVHLREREEIIKRHNMRWEKKMKRRREKEMKFLEISQKRVSEYEDLIHAIRVHDSEQYLKVKLKLEVEVQNLEQLLQRLRATCQLNQEKLEYNFQVLKKRDEENTIIKSKQKRKITRLQDTLNNYKCKLSRQERHYKEENQQLTDDYKRLTEQFQDLEKRAKHFMASDVKRFTDLWNLNEEICKDLLLNGVLSAQRAIFEQQLGLTWKEPNLSFTENKGPITVSTLNSDFTATQILTHIMTKGGATGQSIHRSGTEGATKEESTSASPSTLDATKAKLFKKISPVTIKAILKLICDESDFLIEVKLNSLLDKLEKDERMLIKLDSVFNVLGVSTESDINNLTMFFWLSSSQVDSDTKEASYDMLGKKSLLDPKSQAADFPSSETSLEDIDVSSAFGSHVADKKLIDRNDVLRALRSFVEKHHTFQKKNTTKITSFNLSKVEQRKDVFDTMYWRKYQGMLTKDQEKLWDGLLEGLEKYCDILTERMKLIEYNKKKKDQNLELKALLHTYICSKVNKELYVPPQKFLRKQSNESN